MELQGLKTALQGIEDPRRTKVGHILHRLEDIIIIGLCTLICDGEYFTDMEEFGKQREEWLRKFLELPNGIPDSDTFRRVFARLEPDALSECLYDWLGSKWEEGAVVAIDGKTIRGSKSKGHKAHHVVSAFAAENRLVLGELVTEEKSNEITAVPELLDSLNIEGSIVTADAMSCQKEIIGKICAGKADYVIGLKGNQLHWALDVVFAEDASRARKDMAPLNLNVLRKTALALCKHADFGRRISIQKERFAAALNPDRFLDILFANTVP